MLDASRSARAPAPRAQYGVTAGESGPRPKLLGQLSPELLVLWFTEVLMCALVLYEPLTIGQGVDTPPGLQFRVANQALVLALTFGLTSVAVGLYSPDAYLRTRRLLADTAIGMLLASPAVWLVGHIVGTDIIGLSAANPRQSLQALLGLMAILCALRLAFSYALRANVFVRHVLIIGPAAGAVRLAAAIGMRRTGFFEVVPVPPNVAATDMMSRRLARRKPWAVILAGDSSDAMTAQQLQRAREQGVRLYSETEFWERELRRIDIDQPALDQAATAGDASMRPERANAGFDAVVHRLTDIVLSLTLMVFTLPLMLVTAVLVMLDSPGPVLYRQDRVGLNGQVFTLLKFRSMRTDAEALGPVWAAQSDPRVTRVGAFIRMVRIDELPQLINVLRGQMSFIGPRPERPHFVSQLERVLPRYRDRARVKPGLTGWAQVNYPYGASVEDARAKLSYDLYYVKHRSVFLDLLILFATVRVVLFRHGAR